MNLAVIGFNFQTSNYLVFDMDAKKAQVMNAVELKGHNILCANYVGELVKPLYPESKYFIPDLYSKTSPLLQGFIIDEVIPGKYAVYTNQMETAVMTAQQISKLYTILRADLTYPNGEAKVNILEQDNKASGIYTGLPTSVSTPIVQGKYTDTSDSIVSSVTPIDELVAIYKLDVRGTCVVTEKGWPKIHQYKLKDILTAMQTWVKQDYPELVTFYNYFLKYPMLYPPEGKTPLLQRRSYVYAMYRLLKAQIVYTVAIKEVKQGAKIPSLPLFIRPLTISYHWEKKLLARLPKEQATILDNIANPHSIANKNSFCRVTNICHVLGYSTSKERSAGNYTKYNETLYKKHMRRIHNLRINGTVVPFEGLDSATYVEALATLNVKAKPKTYANYCFIKMPTGGYIKLTRPRNATSFGVVTPKAEYVDRAESGVTTYDLGQVKLTSQNQVTQIMEIILYYANRRCKHFEYQLVNNGIALMNISRKDSFQQPRLDNLDDVNEVLDYMYS